MLSKKTTIISKPCGSKCLISPFLCADHSSVSSLTVSLQSIATNWWLYIICFKTYITTSVKGRHKEPVPIQTSHSAPNGSRVAYNQLNVFPDICRNPTAENCSHFPDRQLPRSAPKLNAALQTSQTNTKLINSPFSGVITRETQNNNNPKTFIFVGRWRITY